MKFFKKIFPKKKIKQISQDNLKLKELNLTADELKENYNIIVNLPTKIQQTLYMNDIYLIEKKETKEKLLLIYDIEKFNLNEYIFEINYDEICHINKQTLDLFIQKHSTIDINMNEETGAISFIEALLKKAKAVNATDIYISLFEKDLVIKLRTSLGNQEVARLSIKEAAMIRNTLEYLSTQESGTNWYDSKIIINNDEYRINFYITMSGWDCTIRNYSNEFQNELTLEALGYTPKQIKTIKNICLNQNGMVLYTAQTGQGKTTTQYANLQWLQERGLKVVTAENPVEKKLNEINQVDLSVYETADEEFKLDGKKIVKLFLRAKPDVINMGEIRDEEEALLAYTASITGHLVFGTLHTNSVDSAIFRLEKSGLREEDIKSVVRGIIYQQLTRQLCKHCKIKEDNNGHYKVNKEGCEYCNCGYDKLRTPIVEIAQFPLKKNMILEL